MGRTAAALLWLAWGCGPQSGNSEGGGTGSAGSAESESSAASSGAAESSTSAAETTGGGGDVCVCTFEPDGDESGACGLDVVCELPMPCPQLTVMCPRPGGDLYDCAPEFVYDTDAMRCVIEVLRDDTPAHLLVDGDVDWGIFSGQEQRQIVVLGDGRVVTTSCISTDAGHDRSASLTQSAGADHFSACLELDVPRDQYECLWAGLVAGDDVPACP